MTYAEFKEKFLPQLNDIRSFAGKVRLANQYLTRMGSGSGRIVYDVDGEKALKLAKNRKGIAQNEAEAGAGYYRDTQHIVTEIFDSAEDDSWIIAEKGKKVTDKRIRELTGIPSLSKLFDFLNVVQQDQKSGQNIFSDSLTDDEKEFFWENEFSSDLADFVVNYGQTIGDMSRPSTYGEVMRDGQPTIVLTDYGLNDEVYDTYYSPQRKEKYAMYELFQYADGNDDILSDAGNAKDIKYGMWAQMPYSVSDGDGVINEEFIDFVNNRDSYPDNSISGLPVLTDRFHECVNNIKNIMEAVDDKKRFYGNLLELQNYLIRRGFYNRDPLISEEYQINEDVPDVQPFSLDNRGYADKLANAVADKLELGTPKFIGGGGNGFAYLINNDVVMKLTSDISEADAASKTMRGNPKYIADIHNLYKVIDTDTNQAFFVVMQENIKDKPIHQIRRNIEVINRIEPQGMGYEDVMTAIRKPKRFDYDEMLEFAKHILTDNPEATVSESDRKAAYQFFVGMMNIRKELLELDIKSTDYINIENLGYKNGVLTFFDVGGYFGVNEPDVGDENIISLPENEVIGEKYDREVADKIAKSVGKKLNLNPQYLGGGEFGVAYDIGDNKVLKITRDKSEAQDNMSLIGKPLKYIAQPYKVFEIQTNSDHSHPTYAIILEKLKTDEEYFNRMYNRLDYVFEKIFGVRFKDAAEAIHDNEKLPNNVKPEDIQNYFKKNPKDEEFFYSLLRIWEELEKYGSQSLDFFNPDNLGFKPSGLIGFFDVGFGDGFAKPDAEKMRLDVNEDGTSIYSTDDEIGTDGFPPYNNSNIPPTINNNLDANVSSQMYEDLEYNHVDDATKDEYVLTEEQLEDFIFNDDLVIDVYKNPKSMKRMKDSIRGILDKEGNLYVINDNYNVIHNIFAEWLNLNGYPVAKNTYENLHSTVPLQRFGNSDNFYLSESVKADEIEENLENIVIILRKAKQKNPQYNYIVKNIENAEPNNDKPLVEDRKKSWVKGSKAVTVKQRCRLGGKGDGTSDACNQGDINNLEFTKLDEDVSLDTDFVDGWHRYDILHDGEVAGEMEVSTRDKYMILNKIMINPEHRGMGHANDAMKILTDYADKNNKILALTPDTVWGANKNKLINWYKSWGFVMNKGRNIDYQVRELMTRKPKMTEQSEYQKYSEKSGANDNRINNMHSKLDKLRADNDLKYLKPYLSPEEMQLVYNDTLTSHKYFNTGKNPYAGAHKLKTAAWEKLEKDNPQAYKEYVEKSDKLYNMFRAVQNFSKKKRFGLDKEFQSDEKYGMGGDVDANEVSHFTTTQNAISILRDGYFMEGDEGGVALTTNKDLVKQRKPVFYHPQGDWYEGTTHRNLSTQFVLDFNKMKQDGIRHKRGNENIGTHGGEEEIRVYTKEYELPLHSYLKKVIFDPSKEKREELSQELIDVLKEKNIRYYIKNNEEQTMGKGLDEYYSSLVPRVDEDEITKQEFMKYSNLGENINEARSLM